MVDHNVNNSFDLSYDQINAMKKKDLVNNIENVKRKVTVDTTIKSYAVIYHSYQLQWTISWQKMETLVANWWLSLIFILYS